MKRSVYLLLFSLLVSVKSGSALANDFAAYALYNSNGKKVSFEKMIKNLSEKRYIFFGEYHNNPISHWLQFEVTKELHSKHKKRLVLGAEMFEADNQYIIDEYLNGLISKKNFQEEVRLWPNYNTDYKPLFEYAKANQLKFIATNVPRRYANIVYKRSLGSLDSLSDLAKTYLMPLNDFVFDSTVTCYKDMIASMGGHGSTAIAQAQAVKDATMAWFIQKNTDKKEVFLHYNGAYHSNNHEGILHYLKKYAEAEEMITISTVEQENIDNLNKDNYGLGDYIICVNQNMTKTH